MLTWTLNVTALCIELEILCENKQVIIQGDSGTLSLKAHSGDE